MNRYKHIDLYNLVQVIRIDNHEVVMIKVFLMRSCCKTPICTKVVDFGIVESSILYVSCLVKASYLIFFSFSSLFLGMYVECIDV